MITWGEVLITAVPVPGREETISTGSVQAEPVPLPSQCRCMGSNKTEVFSQVECEGDESIIWV